MSLEKYQMIDAEASRDFLAPDSGTHKLRDSTRARVLDFQSRLERKKIPRSSNEAGKWSAENQEMLTHHAFPETSFHALEQLKMKVSDFANAHYFGSITPYVIAEFFERYHQTELPLAA